jgi:predicted exporter
MKKPSFPLIETARRGRPLVFWIAVHCALFLALGLSSLFWGLPRVKTGLFDILPASGGLRSLAGAEAVLGERNGRQFIILAESAGFLQAKAGAQELFAALSDSPARSGFESIALNAGENYLAGIRQYLYDYRFMLLDGEDRALLENGRAGEMAAQALASVYGAFNTSLLSLDNLEGDPFLLSERAMKRLFASSLASGGNVVLKDGVLAAHFENNWYVMMRGSLTPRGAAINSRESPIKTIQALSAQIETSNEGLRFYCSGVPFHSYESSSNAQREISLISTLSLVIVLLLFLAVFRSVVPALASFAAAGLSILTAIASVMLFFREVHVLAFVFGTTLIGTCVDYSIHFFVHQWGQAQHHQSKKNQEGGKPPCLQPASGGLPAPPMQGLPPPQRPRRYVLNGSTGGDKVRSRVFRAIALSFASTTVCFTALLFAPFTILKQFAVFSISGLSSSFLTVMCLFPLLPSGRKKIKAPVFPFLASVSSTKNGLKALRLIFLAALSACLALIFVNRENIRLENRLGSLYTMPQPLLEAERTSARALNYGSAGWYFIVAGESAEETLKNEEQLLRALDAEIARGSLASCMAVSLFIPSMETQRQSYLAAAKTLPEAFSQFENLGFPQEAARAYSREYAEAAGRYALPGGTELPPELSASLWIGKAGERYYSCVLPLHAKDEEPFRKIAAEQANVYFVNKVKDIGTELDRLTGIMLALFAIALCVIAVVVRLCYPWRKTLRIAAVPLLLVLAVLAVLSCLDIPLGLFPAVGLLLVFGLGLDYMFYITESEKKGAVDSRPLTLLSIFLSFATSALSFGALALSTFIPVHIFGVTVFTGICAAYISAMLFRAGGGEENQRISGPGAESS